MEQHRIEADAAMMTILDQYPVYLEAIKIGNTPTAKLRYYLDVWALIRKNPLPNEKAQSILESKVKKQMHNARNKVFADLHKAMGTTPIKR